MCHYVLCVFNLLFIGYVRSECFVESSKKDILGGTMSNGVVNWKKYVFVTRKRLCILEVLLECLNV